MPNSAGVVGPDYLTPIDIDVATATHTANAQGLVDLGLVVDTSGTHVPSESGIVGPDYITPVEFDLSTGNLIPAVEALGIAYETSLPDPLPVIGPDYMRPLVLPTAPTEPQFAQVMVDAGYFNDTGA